MTSAVLSPRPTQAPKSSTPETEKEPVKPRPICFLKEEHYVVLGSIGTDRRSLKPVRIVADTGSGPSVIRADALPPQWKNLVEANGDDPGLADANGNPLRVTERVRLLVRLGNKRFTVLFYVAPNLAVPVIIGTGVMNRHFKTIHCQSQRIDLIRGGSIAILSAHNQRVDKDELPTGEGDEEGTPDKPQGANKGVRPADIAAHTIRLAKGITIPAMSQMTVAVTSPGGGLSYLEPKGVLYDRHQIRMTNGLAEILPNRPFRVIIANFAEKKRSLPKGTVLGYAQRAPLAVIVPFPDEENVDDDGYSTSSDQILEAAKPQVNTSPRGVQCFNSEVNLIAPGAGTILPNSDEEGEDPSSLTTTEPKRDVHA